MLIKVKNLSKSFGKKRVLRQLNFSLPDFGLVILSGDNGVGKTTLLKILGLLDDRYSGSLTLGGVDVSSLSEEKKAAFRKDHIINLFQTGNDISFLSPSENYDLRKTLFNREGEIKISDNPSQGETMLSILDTLKDSQKEIILLDEVTANLSENNACLVKKEIQELAKTHLVIFATHDPIILDDKDSYRLVLKGGKCLGLLESKDKVKPLPITKSESRKIGFLKAQVLKRDGLGSVLIALASLMFLLFSTVLINLTSINFSYEASKCIQVGDEISVSSLLDSKTIEGEDGFQYDNELDLPTSALDQTQQAAFINSGRQLFSIVPQGNSLLTFYPYGKAKAACYVSTYYLEHHGYHNGDAVPFGGRYLPYEIDDSMEDFVINEDLYDDYEQYDPFSVNGFLWENPNINFSSHEDVQKIFGLLGTRTLVSPNILRRRGYKAPLSLETGTLDVSEPLSYYLPLDSGGKTSFLNYSAFNFGHFDSYYLHFDSFYPEGVKVHYDSAVASYLNANEVLLSQSDFNKIANKRKAAFFHMLITDPAHDVAFLKSSETSFGITNIEPTDSRSERLTYIFKDAFCNADQGYLILPYIIFAFLLDCGLTIGLCGAYCRIRIYDKKILLSYGYSYRTATSILLSGYRIGAVTGFALGLVGIAPAILYVNSFKFLFAPSLWTIVPFAIEIILKVGTIFIFSHHEKKLQIKIIIHYSMWFYRNTLFLFKI